MPRRKVVDLTGLATIDVLLPEFEVSLQAGGRSPRTLQSYVESAQQLDAFLTRCGRPRPVGQVTGGDIDAFTADLRRLGRSSATVAVRYRSLGAFFKWAVRAGELAESPMAGTARPTVDVVPVDFVTEEEIKALLKVVEARERTFDDWRDAAILRLFYDTGCRLSEIAGLKIRIAEEDGRPDSGVFDLERGVVLVLGKGNRWRQVTFGAKARAALRKYLVARSTHELAASDWLWVGSRHKPLSGNGIAQMLERRCDQAGIRRIHPHMFRHAAAHDALSRGMSEGDAMTFFGWKTRDMLTRYGAKLAEERALEAARRIGAPGDRL